MRVQELHSGSYHKHKQPASSPGGRVVLNLRKWVSLRKCYLCLAEGFWEAPCCCQPSGDSAGTVTAQSVGATKVTHASAFSLNPRRTKIGGPEKTASFHRGAHLAGKSSLLIHESFDEFSVFRAIPATEQVLSGLGFCHGWQEWHGLP